VDALDLPGFGRTRAPGPALDIAALAGAVRAWSAAAGPERPVLVGVSFGCQVVVEAAAHDPSFPLAVVLCGPTIPPHLRSFRSLFAQRFGAGADEPRRLTPLAVGDYVRSGLRRVLATYRDAVADRPEDRAPGVGCPSLVVRGERDTLVDEGWAALLTERLPRGRLATIPDAAHSVQLTAPDAVAAAITRFLRTGG
jgi:pimeloyl-ACP methyl ester carboxylesterase